MAKAFTEAVDFVQQMRRIHLYIISLLCFGIYSCKSTRFVPEGSCLLTKQKVKIRSTQISPSNVERQLTQKTNKRLLGVFRNRLFFYNISAGGKERKLKNWVKTELGTPPVLYDSLLTEKSKQNIRTYLENEGYYFSEIEATHSKRRKKVKVTYAVKTGKPYIIKDVNWHYNDSSLDVMRTDTLWATLKPGKRFRLQLLKDAQSFLRDIYQNRAYYDFDYDDVSFVADTFAQAKLVTVDVYINQKLKKQNDSLIERPHQKHYVQNVYIFTDFNHKEYLVNRAEYLASLNRDTAETGEIFLYSKDNLKRDMILRFNKIRKGEEYNFKKTVLTQQQLSENKLFKQVAINYSVPAKADSNRIYLDCNIQISQFTLQQMSLNLQGTNTGGDIGAGVDLTYRHRNLFKGAEALSIRVKTSQEINRALSTDEKRVFNNQEYGADAEIEIPRFLMPFKMEGFDKRFAPSTVATIGFYYVQTPDYTSPRAFGSYGYRWRSGKNHSHNLTLFDLSGIRYKDPSERFEEYLEKNQYFKYSYEDNLISSTNYNYIYYNKKDRGLSNSVYVSSRIEFAGNVLNTANNLLKTDTAGIGYYKMFETRFAQYAKAEIDLRYYFVFDEYNTSVFRLNIGTVVPYGNSDVVPSIKQYYAGGANSMRAWEIRSLGPGRFVGDSLNTSIKYNQGDAKFELNYEHRFHLFWYLNGAAFIDIGNIWSLNNKLTDEASLLSAANFFSSLAVGTGFGLRFDFSFFVLRMDVGLKTRDPAISEGTKWVWFNKGFSLEDANPTLSVGYPF